MEYFFYVYFVVTILSFINSIIIDIVTTSLNGYLLVQILILGFLSFYTLSIVYSFVLEQEQEYRTQRKRYTDNIAEKDMESKLMNEINRASEHDTKAVNTSTIDPERIRS